MDKATEDLIRARARFCCEYCLMPQEYDDLPFQCDHIIAKTHDGSDGPEYKGTNLSGVDPQTRKVVRLFDPRRQNWTRHFRWSGAVLEGKTQTGRATVRVLRINMPIRMALRQSLIGIGEFPPRNA